MKNKVLNSLSAVILFLMPSVIFAQSPPDLGSATGFALFTAAGAFTNSGASTFVTGDVGTNVGAFSAFPPGILVGQIHVADPASAQAATDVDLAYGYMSTITCGSVISTTMGGGQMLLPNVYCLGAASTINGDLILDGQGDPSSLFIFKIDGALATTVNSRVILTNSANMCNVYWQVNGQVDLGDNSLFQGTLLVNGAINLLEAAELQGRALSRAGAIALHNNIVNLSLQAEAGTISAAGATTICAGDSVVLSGNTDGVWSNGSTSASITVNTGGDYFVTNTTGCGSDTSNHILVTVNPLPIASIITGATAVCEGATIVLSGNNGGTWNTGETTASITVSTAGDYFVTNTNGCGSVTSNIITVTVNPLPAADAGSDIVICEGTSTAIGSAAVAGNTYSWEASTGSSGFTSSNPTVSPDVTTTYTLTETVTATGCEASNVVTVTVVLCAPSCSAPVITSVDSVCGNDAIMCWTPVQGATGYIVIWNKLPDTTWIYTMVDGSENCYQFTNHFGDVNELQVAAICDNGDTSAFSAVVTWTNYLICAAPTSLTSTNITATSADLSWSANADATKYKVLYKGGGNKTIVDVNGTTLSVTNLSPSTTIKWKVKSKCKVCGSSTWGSYSAFQSFTTPAQKLTNSEGYEAASMLVYPNPAHANFSINFYAGFSTDDLYTLAVQDLLGNIVQVQKGALVNGILTEHISLTNNISSGIYFVVITTSESQFRERLIVIKE